MAVTTVANLGSNLAAISKYGGGKIYVTDGLTAGSGNVYDLGEIAEAGLYVKDSAKYDSITNEAGVTVKRLPGDSKIDAYFEGILLQSHKALIDALNTLSKVTRLRILWQSSKYQDVGGKTQLVYIPNAKLVLNLELKSGTKKPPFHFEIDTAPDTIATTAADFGIAGATRSISAPVLAADSITVPAIGDFFTITEV